MTRSASVSLLAALVGLAGCASMLGIDGDYAPGDSVDGSGGIFGSGDRPSSAAGGASLGEGGSGSALGAGGSRNETGGVGSSGGSSAGGAVSTGGAAPMDAATCDPTSCAQGEKCCPMIVSCMPEDPIIGCGSSGCDSCPAPPTEGVAVCINGACAVQCNDGFALKGTACVAIVTGSGGAQGTGGMTGAGGATGCAVGDSASCPACNIAGPLKCCKNNHTCGCSWAPGFACY